MSALDPMRENVTAADPAIELDLRAGYALWSKSYDSSANALIAVEEPLVDRLLAGQAPARALDVGAGTGRHALRLARRGSTVTALDPSPEMLAIARGRAHADGLPIECVLGSLTAGLPFADEAFDVVLCTLVLCHVADLRSAVAGFYQATRPGGRLLITDFHPDACAFGWRSDFISEGKHYSVHNVLHDRAGYLRAVEAAGYRLREVVDLPVGAIPAESIAPSLQRKYAALNFCLAVLAEKP